MPRTKRAICHFVLAAVLIWPAAPGVCGDPLPGSIASWLDLSERDYPGLLGRRYLAGNYVYLSHGDGALDLLDDSLEGFGVGLNHPVLQPDDESWLGVDLFATWNSLNLGGATVSPPPFSVGLQLDADLSTTSLGTTLYADPQEPIRPFVQVGVSLTRQRTLVLFDGFGGSFVDRETDLLLAAGVEADVTDWLAVRGVFDIDTQDSVSDSTFRGDFIAWPLERLFLRSGVLLPLSGDAVGAHIGLGVSF